MLVIFIHFCCKIVDLTFKYYGGSIPFIMKKLSRPKNEYYEKKIILSFIKIGIIIGSLNLAQATVLIGGDILNGNLNAGNADGDTTDDNFQSTPDWVNVGELKLCSVPARI